VGGVPGAAANLPDIATQATESESQGSQYLRNEQTTNYEVTQTETREIQAPGTVDRISLSVLVDGVSDTNQLQTLNAVIAAAAGIDEARGDTLAVQTLEFDRSYFEEEASQIEAEKKTDLYWKIGEIAGAVVLLAALLWYVQRLMANLRLASSKAWTPVLRPVAEMALPSPSNAASTEATASIGLPVQQAVARSKIELPVLSAEDENLQRLVIRMAEENPAAVAETIQMWLNEGD
jgi:flagellar M-ring protein FliF